MQNYPDVAASKVDPAEHFLNFGWKEGRNPSQSFNALWYLYNFPDAAALQFGPAEHYAKIKRGTSISLVPPAGAPAAWRLKLLDDPALPSEARNFIEDFVLIEKSPLFDREYYSKMNNISANDPVEHFLRFGGSKGLKPSAGFDTKAYIDRYSDVRNSGINPLVHYMRHGIFEGRSIQQFADSSASVRKSRDAVEPQNRIWSSQRDYDAATSLLNGTGDLADEIPPVQGRAVQIASKGVAAISVDIWDTVLRRDCHPDEIKIRSARFLLLHGSAYIRPALKSLRSLFRARIQAENDSAPNDDFEYRFSDAIDHWLDLVLSNGITDSVRARLKDGLLKHEFDAELSSIRPDQPMCAALRLQKKPRIFLSDFYMSSTFIKDLLVEKGLGDIFLSGFASSDHFLTKRSGDMFDKTPEHLGVDAGRILHIGDNLHADVEMPRAKGLVAMHYQSPSELERRAWYERAYSAWLKDDNSVHSDRIARICLDVSRRLESGKKDQKLRASEALGARLAPIAIGYVLDIIENAVQRGVSRVHYFTREGIFFQAVHDAVRRANPFDCALPESRLLSVSRRATFAASLNEPTPKEFMRLWTMYSRQSMKALAVSLNLDERLVAKCCKRHGIEFDETVQYPWQDERCLRLFEDQAFSSHAAERIAAQRRNLVDYLKQQGVPDDGICIIADIGWRGTIHDNIARVLPDVSFVGYYLGLYKYLNAQPDNSRKSGWLFNDNADERLGIEHVAPIEMLFNGPGGSVQGYVRRGGSLHAETLVIAAEEDVVATEVAAFQRGMLAAVEPVVGYMKDHGLMAADLRRLGRDLLRSLVATPPAVFVDAFNRLEHNETFGTGATDNFSDHAPLGAELAARRGAALHAFAKENVCKAPWPASQVFSRSMQDWLSKAPIEQQAALPIEVSRMLGKPAYQALVGSRINFYCPAPIVASGGHRTIFNVIQRLSAQGVNVEVFLEDVGAGIECVENYLGGASAIIHSSWIRGISADIAVSTIAHSSEYIRDVKAAHKAYLVQDFEAMFNPMSDPYIVGERSYTLGHQHYTVGNWLSHMLWHDYGASSLPAGLGNDRLTYKVLPDAKREQAICFLYQPDKPRRTPILGIDALRQVKMSNPEVKIYVYGSNMPLNLDFPVENLGLITDLGELNSLYNRCRAGLCVSGSNPSRIPYEMMAAGCVPVDIYRYNNLMDHEAGTILLAYQDSASIAESLQRIVNDDDTFQSMSSRAVAHASERSLEWEMDVIVNGLMAQLDGKLPPVVDLKRTYTEAPIIAASSRSKGVDAFCATHRKLADRRARRTRS
ncbi:MAG: hypothetical protein ACRCTI_14270 [Beijerinckiaceae bacterium]